MQVLGFVQVLPFFVRIRSQPFRSVLFVEYKDGLFIDSGITKHDLLNICSSLS